MDWLITGGAGFIGSHLADALIEQGDRVAVIDNLSTGRRENIAHLESCERFRFVHGSILDRELLTEAVRHCDGIFHLAAAVGVRLIISQPVETIQTNIVGTETVLSVAAEFQRKILIASTSEVYGKNEKVPFREDHDSVFGTTNKGRWSYACSKAIDEFLALAYHKQKKLPVIIVRFFNTVGPRQTGEYGMVVPTFVGQALANEPVTVFGDGKQSRCFTHVKDTVKATIALMQHPQAVGELFNLGGQLEVSIEALARRVVELTGSKSTIRYLGYDDAYERGFEDMRRRVPDVTKLKKLIGFSPNSNLDAVLQSVIDHFRNGRPLADASRSDSDGDAHDQSPKRKRGETGSSA